MSAADQRTFEQQAGAGDIVATIATNWDKTGALGLASVQDIHFEQWLALYGLAELNHEMELQDMAACHMEMAAENLRQKEIAVKTRARIAERRDAKWRQ